MKTGANKFYNNANGSQLANSGGNYKVWSATGDPATTTATTTPTPAATTTMSIKNMTSTHTGLLVIGILVGSIGTYLYMKKK